MAKSRDSRAGKSKLPQGFKPIEVARALGIPRSSVYALIRSGELPAVKYGRSGLIVLAEDLQSFLRDGKGAGRARL